MTVTANEVVVRLAARDATRTEADLQADVYVLLTAGGLEIDPAHVARLEVPTADGTRRRIDVEIGQAAIEVKKDLRVQGVLADAEKQLAGYIQGRTQLVGARYVGILTDGTSWRLYHLVEGEPELVAHLALAEQQPDADRLVAWLEAVLATGTSIPPTPTEIQRRLGATSPAHLLDHATLKSLFDSASNQPEVQLKRQLWAKLLRTAFGKSFDDDADLFVDHTLLVLSAEIIAHAVVGFNISRTGHLMPQGLARGTAFADALIHGVVESDFFDWVLEVRGGPEFISSLADRISRFDWTHVEHDVLKILYESVIPAEARASLGEYYTPDWLADRVVADAVSDPLEQRVLDPACGSGTFLFHAIRRFLAAWDEAGRPRPEAVSAVTRNVQGLDVHPVAVTLARVTYLLAIGQKRLVADDRPPIAIPVYLGDSIQWEQHRDLLGGLDEITIATAGDDLVEGGGVLFGDDLVFPRSVLQDAAHFDRLVSALADRAREDSTRASRDLVLPLLRQYGVHERDIPVLVQTFDTMRRLHATGRNHIWGYYVRNLIRPLWLSDPNNHVDVIVGNPPWLRYSKMTAPMQQRYKRLAKERGLLAGALGASGRDLSTLFVVRVVEQYLRDGGTFALVMPHGTLTRQPHSGFRSGDWGSNSYGPLKVRFRDSWDLAQAPTGFPMVSCVIRGDRAQGTSSPITGKVLKWRAKLKSPNVTWASVHEEFTLEPGAVLVQSKESMPEPSSYKTRFRQGAVLAPLALLYVVDAAPGPLGAGAGRIAVQSLRTNLEKKPWKDVESLRGSVERSFVRSVALGESIAPFRMLRPRKAVLPVGDSGLLDPKTIDEQPALRQWWNAAEDAWAKHKAKGDGSTLLERIDYHGQLSAQVPAAPQRVVYTKAGSKLAAARISDPSVLVDFGLYWGAVSSEEEALYLTAILNSTALLQRVKPLQTLGLFGARHFDKYVFSVPIPTFDSKNDAHQSLVALARRAEQAAAAADLSGCRDFKAARVRVKEQIAPTLNEVNEIVLALVHDQSGC